MTSGQAEKRSQSNRLSQALASVRGPFVATVVFSFFINLLMFVAPLYMLQVYDRVLGSRNETTLVMLTIIAGGMLFVFGLLELVRSRVLVRIGCRLDRVLNDQVFSSVFERTVKQPSTGHSQALRDLDSLREFLTGPGLIAFCDAPWVPLFLAVVFLFHPVLGLVALVGALIIFLLALANEILTRKPLSDASKASVGANTFVSTSLRNAEAVQAMGMLSGIMSRWSAKHQDVIGLQAQASDRAGLILSSSKAIRMFLQVAILGAGAYLVLQQEITPGTMIAASIIMGRALAPVEAAVGQWRSFVNARTGYRRLNDLLLNTNAKKEQMSLPSPRGHVTVEGIVVAPPGSRTPVLKGVSFEVPAGEALGVIGPSGAGKSTLARALVGVWPAANGSVRLDGADLHDWDKEQLGPFLGYLPQDVELFDGSVAENISRFRDMDSDAVVRAAGMAGVHEMILRLPDGYDTQIGAGGQALSGGQRQRVALARALYGDVRFVLLDEPNANLDTEGEKALIAAIGRLRGEGRTVVIITHRPQLLSGVDKVLAIDSGRVQAFGPREDVLARYIRPSVVSEPHSGRSASPDQGSPSAGRDAGVSSAGPQQNPGGGEAARGAEDPPDKSRG
ncbi:type I secretion system permease/ATPase [Rhodovibrio sodomensis]|uniref:Type I secretion system permease/ATPase n=1 Tax=Rhodovibrio sodomensis TaxID=1088 RepID=A0ABS1DFI5_9PROT|nr:type I secretion system permease/ATPase [Rhodovibrio sodomensis]